MTPSRVLACPRCPDSGLDTVAQDAHEIDMCADCRGIWLDAGEWRPVVGPAATTSAGASLDPTGAGTSCPACAATRPGDPPRLIPCTIVGVEGVTIDTCPACEGAWLDGGELPKIRQGLAAARARAIPTPIPPNAPAPPAPPRTPTPGRDMGMGEALAATAGSVLAGLLQVAATARPGRRGWGRRHRGGWSHGNVHATGIVAFILRLLTRR